MHVLAFAASSSTQSINKKLVTYATTLIQGATTEVVDLNDYELPLFSQDREAELGHPERAQAFMAKIAAADALLISFAEHNGAYTAAYKNLFDWCSRIDPKVFQGKAVAMLSTSPGPGGAGNVLNTATGSAPYFNGVLKASLSVPSFYDNFDVEQNALKNPEIQTQLQTLLDVLVG